MSGTHIVETVWYNAAKVIPDTGRNVVVVFKHFNGSLFHDRVAMARINRNCNFCVWEVDSTKWNPSFDVVTQWAEMEISRGGMMPDDFPNGHPHLTCVSNKR